MDRAALLSESPKLHLRPHMAISPIWSWHAAYDVLARGRLGYHQVGRSMSLEEAILDKVRRLPPAKQEEVLRFADGLQDSAL